MFTGLSAIFNVYGKSFTRLNAVYLSGTPITNSTFYNPFSAVPRLSANYPGFSGYKLSPSEYTTNFDNTITINIPAPSATGYIDVIAQNPAGYGILTQYVIKELYNNILTQEQLRPWFSGVQVLSGVKGAVVDYIFAIDGDSLITISGDDIVSI